MEKIEYRAYIKTRAVLGISATEIFKELVTAWGDDAPQYRTVAKWVTLFKDGRESLEDDPRSGRPITMFTQDNIALVKQLIDEDPHATYDELEAETCLSRGMLHQIIHVALRMRKLTSRWIPHQLTDEQRVKRLEASRLILAKFKEGKWRLGDIITGDESWFYFRQIAHKLSNKSWVAEGETPRTVVRQNRFESKNMFSIMFKSTGPLHVQCVKKGESITADYYIRNCLSPAIQAINQQRPTSGTTNMKILHDNAKPHVTLSVRNYLDRKGIAIIDHPPYSPDLAPSDFWLFDKIKQQLSDHTSVESLKLEITSIVKNIPKEEYLTTFKKWLERLEMCIKNEGHYFEHLIK
jgi:[histone H3]-lysine36 N-dimethyltransferase SETMAR